MDDQELKDLLAAMEKRITINTNREVRALDDKISINCTKLDNLKTEVGELRKDVASYAEMTEAAGNNVVSMYKDMTRGFKKVNERLDNIKQ